MGKKKAHSTLSEGDLYLSERVGEKPIKINIRRNLNSRDAVMLW